MATTDTGRTTQPCPACGAAVDVTNAEPLARVACPDCGEKVRVERAFDNFVVVETLGVGGMGSVYKARDTRLDRFVALKLLRSELSASPAEAARLEQEARATAAVNHPHVVQVFSSGYDHGQFYLVMELVDRGSLDDLMAQQTRIAEPQGLQIGIQIAQGLRAACEKGLIHRDVKPANILFADAETAKIGDFGLAIAAEQNAEAQNEIWGTPYYVAPERLRAEPEDFGSDLYSLGATLFHALAGRPPFEGESNSATQLLAMKQQPLDLRSVAPGVSRATAKIIERTLASDPQARFQSYDELIRDLQRARAVLVRDPATIRKRRLAIAASIIAAVAVISAGVFAYRARQKAMAAGQNNTAAVDAVLLKSFDEARHELIAGNTERARSDFGRLAEQAKDRPPLLNWVRIHRALASLLRDFKTQAHDLFDEIAKQPVQGENGRFFVDTSRRMANPAVIRSTEVAEPNPKTPDAFALFLFAMKDWQQREFTEAASLLERFEHAEVPPAFRWMNDYKPFAQKYLADYARYAALKPNGSVEQQLAATRETQAKLQTRGAMAKVLEEQEAALSHKPGAQPATPAATQQQPLNQQPEMGAPNLSAAVATYRQKVAAYDFAGALGAVQSAQATEPLKSQRDVFVQKARWLAEWKEQLIAAINQRGFTVNITDKMGVAYVGIANADQTRLTMKLPYGQIQIEWTKLSPQALLAVATALIPPRAPDAADRQWRCAVFAAETGLPADAQRLGNAAASAKPEYRKALPLLTNH